MFFVLLGVGWVGGVVRRHRHEPIAETTCLQLCLGGRPAARRSASRLLTTHFGAIPPVSL